MVAGVAGTVDGWVNTQPLSDTELRPGGEGQTRNTMSEGQKYVPARPRPTAVVPACQRLLTPD